MNKLSISLIVGTSVIVSSLGGALLFNGAAHGEWDLPGLNQQVQHLTEQSANHEARITNVENKVNTPVGLPTPTPVVVTQVVTQAAPTAVPTPATAAPVTTPTVMPTPKTTIVSSRFACEEPGNYITYETMSDGTVERYPSSGHCNISPGGTTVTTNPITP